MKEHTPVDMRPRARPVSAGGPHSNKGRRRRGTGWDVRRKHLLAEIERLKAAGRTVWAQQLQTQLNCETQLREQATSLQKVGKREEAMTIMKDINALHGHDDARIRCRLTEEQRKLHVQRWTTLHATHCSNASVAVPEDPCSSVTQQQSHETLAAVRDLLQEDKFREAIAAMKDTLQKDSSAEAVRLATIYDAKALERCNALKELLAFLEKNEAVEAVQFGGWQSCQGGFCSCIKFENQDRALSWEEAKPLLDGGWPLAPHSRNHTTYSTIVWTVFKSSDDSAIPRSGRVIRQYVMQDGGIGLDASLRNPPPLGQKTSTRRATFVGDTGSWA